MACGGWVVLGWGVSGSYTALCSDLLLSVTLPCAWEGGKVMITKFCISHFDSTYQQGRIQRRGHATHYVPYVLIRLRIRGRIY